MTPDEVRDFLVGTVFGPVRFVGGTGSTNADLLADARAGAPEGLVIVADHQTAGRGRRGRSWVAPAGSALLASVLLRPRRTTGAAALLSPATALAVRDACAAAGADVRLKWPNDVIATAPGEAKLAGVLAELQVGPDGRVAVVAGFGVNLRSHAALASAVAADAGAEPESGFAPLPPVALEAITDHAPHRNELLVAVLLRLDAWYRRLGEPAGERDLLDELRRNSATLGCHVRVLTPGGAVTGRAEDLTVDGRLLVATRDGPVAIAAGDCHHLRSGSA
ncbi:MAG: biotin--[acetyl-CoA-carboxylase] ligase [Acidimicrobiia bacterium]|nr:biotin--[acetyl-CoA-carboxylase] ligase [Acidimicrobiia bacterium]MYC45637.1 biotin--[acetyl-CoA-carboxylase] ligase [Acidimicrobiia bacterium]MYI20131.1 biotin--[acetyl-CoA-carboxylase] ligase [Acidimicrobiia bacterium]